MTTIPTQALELLQSKFDLQLVVLYGSFATGTQTPRSDIDLMAFGKVPLATHLSDVVHGFPLDAWIYPLETIDTPEDYVHIVPCQVLLDTNGWMPIVEAKVNELRKATSEKSDDELEQLRAWVKKMLVRAADDTPDANYRYHWLLTDLPELYCNFKKQYYDGPTKTLERMRSTDYVLFTKYERLLSGTKDVERLRELFREFL